MSKNEMYDELLEHWRLTYSWRGLDIEVFQKRYGFDKETILATMREIAHVHRNPNMGRVKDEKPCRSCGMPMVFMDVIGKEKPHPCDVRERKILTKQGVFEIGRESHFASCPDAAWWRKGTK